MMMTKVIEAARRAGWKQDEDGDWVSPRRSRYLRVHPRIAAIGEDAVGAYCLVDAGVERDADAESALAWVTS